VSIDNKDVQAKLDELEKSKAGLEDNLKAHMGAIQVLQQLLDSDKEMGLPVEAEVV
jgi:hypothetical protein